MIERSNQEWTIQRHWQYWVQDTEWRPDNPETLTTLGTRHRMETRQSRDTDNTGYKTQNGDQQKKHNTTQKTKKMSNMHIPYTVSYPTKAWVWIQVAGAPKSKHFLFLITSCCFHDISVISWQSLVLLEEVTDKFYHIEYTSPQDGTDKLTTLVGKKGPG